MKICGMPGAVSRIPVANRERLRAYQRAAVGGIGKKRNALVCAHLDDVVVLNAGHGLPGVAKPPDKDCRRCCRSRSRPLAVGRGLHSAAHGAAQTIVLHDVESRAAVGDRSDDGLADLG